MLRSAAGGPRLPRDRRGRIAKGAKLHRFAPPAPHHISTQLLASSSSESGSESSDQDVGGASTGDVMDLVRMADAPAAAPTARPHDEGAKAVDNEEANTERARLRSKDKEWLINEIVALRVMTSQLREQVASTSIELHSLKEDTKRKKNTARRNASRRAKRRAKHMELDGDLSAAPPATDSCQADDEAANAVKHNSPP